MQKEKEYDTIGCSRYLKLLLCSLTAIVLTGALTLQFVKASPLDDTVITSDTTETVTPTPTPTLTPTVTPKPAATPKPLKNGWVTAKNGKKRYYKNGKYYTGLRKINGNTYYFSEKGYMKTSIWKKFSKGYSYFNYRGVRLTGVQKVRKKYYYFNKNGIRQTKNTKAGKITYYIDSKGILEAWKKGSKYYKPNGKAMSKVKARDFETLQTAKKIAGKITTSGMSKSAKLKKCFDWVISKPYVTRRTFSNTAGWPAVYANDHFILGGGNCFSDASAFAYLAKAIGYTDVYVCVDSKGSNGHAWTKIGNLYYDPLFAEAKSYSSYYGNRYYPLDTILKISV